MYSDRFDMKFAPIGEISWPPTQNSVVEEEAKIATRNINELHNSAASALTHNDYAILFV